jgi:hypothetical protein
VDKSKTHLSVALPQQAMLFAKNMAKTSYSPNKFLPTFLTVVNVYFNISNSLPCHFG